MPTTDLLTTAEVADLKGTSVATVNRWAANGRLRVAHRLPGRTGANLFDRADVEALTDSGPQLPQPADTEVPA